MQLPKAVAAARSHSSETGLRRLRHTRIAALTSMLLPAALQSLVYLQGTAAWVRQNVSLHVGTLCSSHTLARQH